MIDALNVLWRCVKCAYGGYWVKSHAPRRCPMCGGEMTARPASETKE